MTSKFKVREPVHFVHQDAIFCETIRKELRYQRLFTKFTINPFVRKHAITGKVNSYYDLEEGKEDEYFSEILRRHALEPYLKYPHPETEGQEYGWDHDPLVTDFSEMTRLHYPKKQSAITKYMDVALKQAAGRKI